MIFLSKLLFSLYRYKGTFCTQDVAIKALKDEYLYENVQREFAQEVYIMRCVT